MVFLTMVTLSPAQSAAVDAIVDWFLRPTGREFYLAGYAGSGKTTITEGAISRLKSEGCGIVRTGAYTGKAANVMRSKGAENAQTIHSMIYSPVENEVTGEVTFEINHAGDASTADLIVLDECSMIGDEMAADIRSFGKRILVLGDPGQLPPIRGEGAFTSREPDVFLTEIHRQAADSPIIRLATMARMGEPIAMGDYGPGVRVVPFDAAAGEFVYDPDTQVICGMNRTRWNLTQKIRGRLGYSGPDPAPGEQILCCKNDRDLGIFNGQQGELVSFSRPRGKISAEMDGGVRVEDELTSCMHFDAHFGADVSKQKRQRGVQEFDWGYVLTCHKSQGSQWKRVTVVDESRVFRENASKWLYTAITRAESELTIIGRRDP